MKVVFHATNGIGLGHINRCLTIADSLRKISSEFEIGFVSSTSFKEIFNQRGFDYVKCPHLSSENYNDSEINSEIYDSINSLNPDIIVYDTHYPQEVVSKFNSCGKIQILLQRKLRNKEFENYISNFQMLK